MMSDPAFVSFTWSIVGLPVSRIWRGYGSAIFLEFGQLLPGRLRRDGSEGGLKGEWTLAIEWSWRIEGKRRIWCGSWSEEEKWQRTFARIEGAAVVSVELQGRLPEIDLSLSNGLHVLSMMTADGDPRWWLTRHVGGDVTSIAVRAGRLYFEPKEPKELDARS